MSKAAAQLGLKEAQLYAWRIKARQVMNTGEREQQLADENVRLKRQLAEQAEELALVKKAAAYFAKHLK
nr:transposase [Aeromonas hydrophila]